MPVTDCNNITSHMTTWQRTMARGKKRDGRKEGRTCTTIPGRRVNLPLHFWQASQLCLQPLKVRPGYCLLASLFFSFALHQNRDFFIRACHSFLSGGVSCVAPATEHVSFPFRGGAGAAERKSSFAVHAHTAKSLRARGRRDVGSLSLLLAAGAAMMGGARQPARCCVARTARPLPACRFVPHARAASRPRTGRRSACC